MVHAAGQNSCRFEWGVFLELAVTLFLLILICSCQHYLHFNFFSLIVFWLFFWFLRIVSVACGRSSYSILHIARIQTKTRDWDRHGHLHSFCSACHDTKRARRPSRCSSGTVALICHFYLRKFGRFAVLLLGKWRGNTSPGPCDYFKLTGSTFKCRLQIIVFVCVCIWLVFAEYRYCEQWPSPISVRWQLFSFYTHCFTFVSLFRGTYAACSRPGIGFKFEQIRTPVTQVRL